MKYKYSFLLLVLTIAFGCENKPSETSEKESKDSSAMVKKDSLAKEEAKVAPLTGKAAEVGKKWVAKEVKLGSLTLPEGAVDMNYDFKQDYTFDVLEGGVKESGKWKVDEEGKTLTLEYNATRSATYKIKELTSDKFVIEGKENDVFRVVTLVPQK